MAVVLGKRKRVTETENKSSSRKTLDAVGIPDGSDNEEQDERGLKEIFRRHFEARFKPLEVQRVDAEAKGSSEDGDEDEDDDAKNGEDVWEGFESGDEDIVTVVEHGARVEDDTQRLDKQELKAFMSSKPPSITATKSQSKNHKSTASEEDEEEDSTANLRNDLALKRLLSESHLLDNNPSSTTSAYFDPSGKNRHKALDLRFQSLGAKDSVYKQTKMPMSHRRGIVESARRRERVRRMEAKESGVVLEREQRGSTGKGKRERAVGGPSVGKFRGGMLMLSRRDVASIEGPRKGVRGKKGRRR